MRYSYKCDECEYVVEINKPVALYDEVGYCRYCGQKVKKLISRINLDPSIKYRAEYNPGLGCVVKDKKHKEQILKKRGLIELGTENINKHADKIQREKEIKRIKEWDTI